MTMLIHTRGPFERAAVSSGNQDVVAKDAAKANLATIKRFCMRALPVLIAAAALSGIIALKAAIYFWRFHY
jgi:hypothetical protein